MSASKGEALTGPLDQVVGDGLNEDPNNGSVSLRIPGTGGGRAEYRGGLSGSIVGASSKKITSSNFRTIEEPPIAFLPGK